jgi:hypothetical protein
MKRYCSPSTFSIRGRKLFLASVIEIPSNMMRSIKNVHFSVHFFTNSFRICQPLNPRPLYNLLLFAELPFRRFEPYSSINLVLKAKLPLFAKRNPLKELTKNELWCPNISLNRSFSLTPPLPILQIELQYYNFWMGSLFNLIRKIFEGFLALYIF